MKEKTKVALFKYLTVQEVNWMLAKWQPRHVPADTIIIKEGMSGGEMFIIEAGRVEMSLRRGDVVLLITELQEPSFFGEIGFLTDKPRPILVKAKTDCRFLALKKQDFLDIVNENPGIAAKFLLAISENLCNQMIATNNNLEHYFLENQTIVDNESFRKLYVMTHKALSSSG